VEEQGPKRPYRLLRALLSVWLLGWGFIIALFVFAQFDNAPLFNWQAAAVWFGIMAGGWLVVFFVLRRLQKMPPE
jgi:hypothetical protein